MEATRNARTHAVSATAVAVRLEWSPTRVAITVTDDGDGYAASAISARKTSTRILTARETA